MSILRASLLGGVDGIITSFAIASGSHAGSLDRRVVLVVGTSSLIADGLSMGVSEYLSSSSERAELSDQSEREGAASPLSLSVACFAAFVACGSVPLASYLLSNADLLACTMFSLATLMLLGAMRTRFSKEPLLLGLGQTAVLGSIAGGCAAGVGFALKQ